MNITSSALTDNEFIPAKYTCVGENVNPPLTINDVPPEAKSLVLMVDDPDAPTKTWSHWIIWNINPNTTTIPENSVPDHAVAGRNDFNTNGYDGPCPPSGTHHYHFKLYALDEVIELPSSSKQADLEATMDGHILAKAELVGLFKK